MPGLRCVVVVVEDGLGGHAAFAEDRFCCFVEDAGEGFFADGFRFFEEACVLCSICWELVL